MTEIDGGWRALIQHLVDRYKFPEDQAERVVETVHRHGLSATPVDGGYIDVKIGENSDYEVVEHLA
jgi:hypothetical protein